MAWVVSRLCAPSVAMIALCACTGGEQPTQSSSTPAARPAATESPFIITASIKELMDSTVDPAADGLWDSVAIISTMAGVEHRQPRTEEEWKAVRRHAVTLLEATNLLVMDGRRAAPAGTQPGEGELSPEEIDQRIAGSRPALIQLAHGLQAATVKALDAIDKKDAAALLQAGAGIDTACEACHLTYWYPNQKIPRT